MHLTTRQPLETVGSSCKAVAAFKVDRMHTVGGCVGVSVSEASGNPEFRFQTLAHTHTEPVSSFVRGGGAR